MADRKYNIGISCIGSGVGQSVVNSLRLSRLPFQTIGFGNNPFAYGAYDCDLYDYTPSIYDKGFLENLISICLSHKIDLLIPGLDDEVLLYAQNANKFAEAGIKTLCSDEPLVAFCRDKKGMSGRYGKISDIFVKSQNITNLQKKHLSTEITFPLIAKPNSGCASRGIKILENQDDLNNLSDDYIIQEIAFPQKTDINYNLYIKNLARKQNLQVSEISVQLVYNQERMLIGRMSSYNTLRCGIPIEIVPIDRLDIWDVIDRLSPYLLELGLKGPINIQGRLTEKGFKIFEMNPRFTGITALRALMGFNEVEACVKEWLKIDAGKNSLTINNGRFGIRQTTEKSLEIKREEKVKGLQKKVNLKSLDRKQILLITGSTGYIGRNLVAELIRNHRSEFETWILKRNRKKDLEFRTDFVSIDDLRSGRFSLGHIDTLLHLGFARPYKGNQQIADSLNFTQELFTLAVQHHIPRIINVSSQSVYGQNKIIPWIENTPVEPLTVYGQAKYASELFLRSLKTLHNHIDCSSLRLSSISGYGGEMVVSETDFLYKMVKLAYLGKTITVIDGSQIVERLDIRDTISALIAIMKSNSRNWKPIYNIGPSKPYTLLKIAQMIVKTAPKYTKGNQPEIKIKNTTVNTKFSMDCNLFETDFSWYRHFDLIDTIESLFEYFTINAKIDKEKN